MQRLPSKKRVVIDGVVKSPLYRVVAHFRSLRYLFARHTICMASLAGKRTE